MLWHNLILFSVLDEIDACVLFLFYFLFTLFFCVAMNFLPQMLSLLKSNSIRFHFIYNWVSSVFEEQYIFIYITNQAPYILFPFFSAQQNEKET